MLTHMDISAKDKSAYYVPYHPWSGATKPIIQDTTVVYCDLSLVFRLETLYFFH